MLIAAYARGLKGIKTELSRYSHLSVFNAALNYLQPKGRQTTAEHMPWVVMFLLKMSLLQKDGPVHMNGNDFLRVANRIFNLSDHVVSNIPDTTFFLMIRAMLAQQLWYQIPLIDSLRYVFLHRTLFNRSYETNNGLFSARVGISLDDYFKIALYLFTLASKKPPNNVIRYSLPSLYSHLSPQMSDETLASFLTLVAIPFAQLPNYIKNFAVKDSNAAELYQETPLKNKPIIIENNELVIFNSNLCILGLRSIAIEVLKADPKFSNRFGKDVEDFIGERLRLTPMDVYAVPDLNNKIPVKIGKISDYVVSNGKDLLIFESKSIIPNALMKCAFDSDHLFNLLRDNFIKGIEQGQETAYKLARSQEFSGMKSRIIIVTLDDFFIYGGSYIEEHISSGFEQSLVEKYGALPVPMSNVLYMKLTDLVVLTEWLKDKPADALFDFLDELEAKQQEPGGGRFSLSQHIDEHVSAHVIGSVGMRDTVDQSRAEIESLLYENKRYWKAQHVNTFMRAYDQFRQRVTQSFV